MEPVVPALHPRGRGVGDVLPAVRPAHLIPLALHQRDEFLPGGSVPHALVDGIHQPELAAALKNVIALSCGVCDGLGYQDNTKALLMTRAMAEITRLGEKLGGSRQTFGGLAGMGDLIVTCTSMHSRNRRAGILIGQGKTPREAMEEVGAVVEGYFAAESIHQLSERVGVEMPISRCAYEVLYQGKQIRGVVAELMTRAKKDELLETAWL